MSETSKNKKWNEETVNKLLEVVGNERPVQPKAVEEAAEALGVSTRSIASKLRTLDVEVASLAKERVVTFSEEQTESLKQFVLDNSGLLTYKEIAEQFPGEFSPKQIQGKLLALELTDKVKPAEHVVAARTYSPEEEEVFIKMAKDGAYIEEIAETLGKEIPSIRGKALSLTRSGHLEKIPAQKQSHAKDVVDSVAALGENIVKMTVSEIAKAVDKTERGVRTLLTRRGITVADYDGKKKSEKAQGKAAAKATA